MQGMEKSVRGQNFTGKIAPYSLGSGHSKTTNGVFWCAKTVEYAYGLYET